MFTFIKKQFNKIHLVPDFCFVVRSDSRRTMRCLKKIWTCHLWIAQLSCNPRTKLIITLPSKLVLVPRERLLWKSQPQLNWEEIVVELEDPAKKLSWDKSWRTILLHSKYLPIFVKVLSIEYSGTQSHVFQLHQIVTTFWFQRLLFCKRNCVKISINCQISVQMYCGIWKPRCSSLLLIFSASRCNKCF